MKSNCNLLNWVSIEHHNFFLTLWKPNMELNTTNYESDPKSVQFKRKKLKKKENLSERKEDENFYNLE